MDKVGTNKTAKEYQKEMMADQPANRSQTPKANAKSDAKDYGKIKGNEGELLLKKGGSIPTKVVSNPESYGVKGQKGKRI